MENLMEKRACNIYFQQQVSRQEYLRRQGYACGLYSSTAPSKTPNGYLESKVIQLKQQLALTSSVLAGMIFAASHNVFNLRMAECFR